MEHAAQAKVDWTGGVSPMQVSYGKLMMWFFLVSDAFTFAGLLITYGMVRSSHPSFSGAIDDFTFSTSYWPVPERVFNSIPFFHGLNAPPLFFGVISFFLFFRRLERAARICRDYDIYPYYELGDHGVSRRGRQANGPFSGAKMDALDYLGGDYFFVLSGLGMDSLYRRHRYACLERCF